MRDAKRLCDDVRALAADSALYRRRATDSLADWGEGMTILQRCSHTPTDIRAHEESFADEPPLRNHLQVAAETPALPRTRP